MPKAPRPGAAAHDALRGLGAEVLAALRGAAPLARGLSTGSITLHALDQGLMLPEAVRILAALLESGHHVYVHCTAGINRASLVAVGWLTFVEGLRLEEAVEQVKGRRAQAHPYLDSWYAAKDIILGPHGARLTALAEAQYQARCERGEEGDSASDWRRAERQLLQDLFRRKVACDLSLAGAFEAVGPALDSEVNQVRL